MKQHITIEQLNELFDKGKEKELEYREKWYKLNYKGDNDLRWPPEMFWNIGIIIEFLRDKSYDVLSNTDYEKVCDALWEPVKKILNGVEKS